MTYTARECKFRIKNFKILVKTLAIIIKMGIINIVMLTCGEWREPLLIYEMRTGFLRALTLGRNDKVCSR